MQVPQYTVTVTIVSTGINIQYQYYCTVNTGISIVTVSLYQELTHVHVVEVLSVLIDWAPGTIVFLISAFLPALSFPI